MLIAFNMYDGTRSNYSANTPEQANLIIREANPKLGCVDIKFGIPMTVESGSNPALEPTMVYLLTESPEMNNPDAKYNYMMLSRLQADCDYFLNHGGRNIKHLWAGNVSDQIQKMKDIYNNLPEPPEWLTMQTIETYEKQMKGL